MDTEELVTQIVRGNLIALIPNPRTPAPPATPSGVVKRWYTMREVGEMLGFGLAKVKMLVITREIRSVKVGKYRRILPEWVDEYVARSVDQEAS